MITNSFKEAKECLDRYEGKFKQSEEDANPEYRLLMGHPIDYKKTVQEMIKSHPTFVVDHIVFAGNSDASEYVEFYREGKKVSAIKHRRIVSGEGLKEAKGFIDDLWDLFHQKNY